MIQVTEMTHLDFADLTTRILDSWKSHFAHGVTCRIFISWKPPSLTFLKVNFDAVLRVVLEKQALSSKTLT